MFTFENFLYLVLLFIILVFAYGWLKSKDTSEQGNEVSGYIAGIIEMVYNFIKNVVSFFSIKK